MSNENDLPIPDEDGTQSLNQMVADIKSLKATVAALEIKVDAQSKRTNANLLEMFAQLLQQVKVEFAEIVEQKLVQAKADFAEIMEQKLVQAKADFAEIVEQKLVQAKAEIKAEVVGIINQEIASFRAEVKEEFKQIKIQLKNTDRQFFQALKYVGEISMRTSDIEDKVEKLEANSPNQ